MKQLIERAKVVAHQHVGARAMIHELIAALEAAPKKRNRKPKVENGDGATSD